VRIIARPGAEAGLILIPEDRKRQGLLEMNVRENLTLSIRHVSTLAGIRRSTCRKPSSRTASELECRFEGPLRRNADCLLSGGNQQKSFRSGLLPNCRILLIDDRRAGSMWAQT